jgi:hypothetical protein
MLVADQICVNPHMALRLRCATSQACDGTCKLEGSFGEVTFINATTCKWLEFQPPHKPKQVWLDMISHFDRCPTACLQEVSGRLAVKRKMTGRTVSGCHCRPMGQVKSGD